MTLYALQKPGQMTGSADWLRGETTAEESNERSEMKLRDKNIAAAANIIVPSVQSVYSGENWVDRVDPAVLIS